MRFARIRGRLVADLHGADEVLTGLDRRLAARRPPLVAIADRQLFALVDLPLGDERERGLVLLVVVEVRPRTSGCRASRIRARRGTCPRWSTRTGSRRGRRPRRSRPSGTARRSRPRRTCGLRTRRDHEALAYVEGPPGCDLHSPIICSTVSANAAQPVGRAVAGSTRAGVPCRRARSAPRYGARGSGGTTPSGSLSATATSLALMSSDSATERMCRRIG